jgi:predicted nucleic acid-binding protein
VDGTIATANLLSVLHDIPLKTLDALHFMIAKDLQADILATSDYIMARGAKALGFSVVQF